MAWNFKGKTYRNLEEQVLENQKKSIANEKAIEEIKDAGVVGVISPSVGTPSGAMKNTLGAYGDDSLAVNYKTAAGIGLISMPISDVTYQAIPAPSGGYFIKLTNPSDAVYICPLRIECPDYSNGWVPISGPYNPATGELIPDLTEEQAAGLESLDFISYQENLYYATELTPGFDYNTAEGYYTVASGTAAHAEGGSTTAIGDRSHAEGSYNYAIGFGSHAEGLHNQAIGLFSHAEGAFNEVKAERAHVEGVYNNITKDAPGAHVEGTGNTATYTAAHAEGANTRAFAWAGHAEGRQTVAQSEASHAEGRETTASGAYAHAEGWLNTASGNSSHVEGYKNTISVSAPCAHVEGQYNTANYSAVHVEGSHNTASNDHAHAEGYNSTASGFISHAEGQSCIAAGQASHVEGFSCETTSSAKFSHVEGYDCKANGESEHVGGNGSEGSAQGSFLHGWQLRDSRWYQAVFGLYNEVPAVDAGEQLIVGCGNSTARANCFVAGNSSTLGKYIKVGNTMLTEQDLENLIALVR